MKKRKGWSTLNSNACVPILVTATTLDTAAASLPSSLTSRTALWTTADTTRSLSFVTPDRSEPPLKICLMPRFWRGSFREYSASILNFGNNTKTLLSLSSDTSF
uniref:Putative secreted protein n=1 Tax=Ixodes ricinus TaxID=34613 RepID=A0A6B0UCU8_IXORI